MAGVRSASGEVCAESGGSPSSAELEEGDRAPAAFPRAALMFRQFAFLLEPGVPGMDHLPFAQWATVTGRVIVGPADRMRAAKPEWPLVEAPRGKTPTITVDEWMASGSQSWDGTAWARVPLLSLAN